MCWNRSTSAGSEGGDQLPDYPMTRLPNSEERDGDECFLVDHILVGRNFDVAIGLRQARDVARSFESRERGAVFEAHRIELMASSRRRDPSAQWNADGP